MLFEKYHTAAVSLNLTDCPGVRPAHNPTGISDTFDGPRSIANESSGAVVDSRGTVDEDLLAPVNERKALVVVVDGRDLNVFLARRGASIAKLMS